MAKLRQTADRMHYVAVELPEMNKNLRGFERELREHADALHGVVKRLWNAIHEDDQR